MNVKISNDKAKRPQEILCNLICVKQIIQTMFKWLQLIFRLGLQNINVYVNVMR